MIKSEIQNKKQELPFPKLMLSSITGNVVLFSDRRIGTFVHLGKGNEQNKIGDFSKYFIMSHFNEYNESVILMNDTQCV